MNRQISTCFLTMAAIVSVPLHAFASAGAFSQFSMPQNMGANINAVDMEQAPAPAPNGLSLYFTSSRTSGALGGNDIWVAQRSLTAAPWGPAQNLGATLNTASNDTVTSISADGLKMFITSNRAGGSGGPDLLMSTRTDPNNDFSWTAPANLGSIVNSSGQDVGGVYVTDAAQGQGWLYFWSDRAETGLGNLYRAGDNFDGTFMPPVPVNELNSPASERGIALSPDGLEAFISSNRLGPATVFAIFVSTRATTSSPWNTPVPLTALNGGSTSSPALSHDGTVLYTASNRTGTMGNGDIYSAVRVSVNRTPAGDFDGDGRSDLSVFRPADGNWWVIESSTNTVRARSFGQAGDRVVAADYDGDGRTDRAIFRPSSGEWWILKSSDDALLGFAWGTETDKPAPGDYDGDGRTDIAVYRDGTWYIIQSSNGSVRYEQFGTSTDVPVTALMGQ